MRSRILGRGLGPLLVLGLLVSACGGDVATPTAVPPVPTATVPAPTATVPAPTATVPAPTATAAPTATPAPKSAAQIAELLRPATVWVKSVFGETAVAPEGIGGGTGIVYDTNQGFILTNAHVVEGASSVQIFQANSTQGRPARVVGRAECDDLAVLKVDDTTGLLAAPLGDTNSEKPGGPVVALGYPQAFELGTDLTVNAGVISKLHGHFAQYQDLVQMDAKITHGNSGGPLVDQDGKVIGINTLGYYSAAGERESGINFAISMSYARPIIKDLEQGKNHNYLGLNLAPNLTTYKSYFGTDDGLVVAGVSSGSPADRAGVQQADLIAKIEGKKITYNDTATREEQVCNILRSHTDGDQIKVTVIRANTGDIYEGEMAIGKTDAASAVKLEKISSITAANGGNGGNGGNATPTAAAGGGGNGGNGGNATPTAAAGGGGNNSNATLVHTDFTKGEKGTWHTGNGDGYTRDVSGGALNIAAVKADTWIGSFPDEVTDLKDGYIAASVLPVGTGHAGLVGRFTRNKDNAFNLYFCYIGNDGMFSCAVQVLDKWTTIVAPAASAAILPNKYNSLGLSIVGTQLYFEINKQGVAKIQDDKLSGGIWGVAVETANGSASFKGSYGEILIGPAQ